MNAHSGSSTLPARLTRLARVSLVVGLAAATVLAAAAILWPTESIGVILPAYLTAYFYWLSLSLGACAVLMMHALSGGRWGMLLGRPLSAAVAPLPLLAILFLPIAGGLEWLYPWALSGAVEGDPILAKKAGYLNVEGFETRAAIYFAFWLILGQALRRNTRPGDPEAIAYRRRRLWRLSGPGLIFYAFSITFATVDWCMSLMPDWYTTMQGVIVMGGQVLAAFAFSTLVALWLSGSPPWSQVMPKERIGDLGSLLFTAIMFWIYAVFMQYLILWSGDLPHEIMWYTAHSRGTWLYVCLAVIACHFAIPYFALLFRAIKRNPRRLACVAGLLLAAHGIDVYWMIMPTVYPQGPAVGWEDLVSWLAVGGLWLAVFAGCLAARTASPISEFGVEEWNDARKHELEIV